MPQLKDLRVDTVSFVRKSATRDPTDPTKPRRLLLWKAQDDPSHQRLQEALAKVEREKTDAIAAREAAEKAQKTAEEKLAKAGTHTNTQKEKKNMATGTASESDLSLAQQQALARAISLLEPHQAHPTVGALVEKLKGAEPDEVEKIEKSLLDMTTLRVELAKGDFPNPVKAERVAKAERELQVALLKHTSGAWQGAAGEMRDASERAQTGMGWKERYGDV